MRFITLLQFPTEHEQKTYESSRQDSRDWLPNQFLTAPATGLDSYATPWFMSLQDTYLYYIYKFATSHKFIRKALFLRI